MNTVQAPSTSYLDIALWKRLNDPATDRIDFAKAWLPLQCAMISAGQPLSEVRAGCVVFKEQEQYVPVAFWPEGLPATPAMSAAAELAIREQRGIVYKPADQPTSEQVDVPIAYPLLLDGVMQGLVVLSLSTVDHGEIGTAMRQLQWGMAALENHCRRTRASDGKPLVMALELTAAGLDAENGKGAAFSIATYLATSLGCDSVSIGFKQGDNVVLAAISHNAHFDSKSSRVRAMGQAMDEALDQKELICYPSSSDRTMQITRAHEALMGITGSASVCTVPLLDRGRQVGAISLEHHDAQFFDADKVRLCQSLGVAVGPVLEVKRLESRWIGAKLADAMAAPVRKLIGPRQYTLKLVTFLLVCALVLMQVVSIDYRVSASATLEGWQQRHIPAAIDGYVARSHAKAGDVVRAGQLLFELDDRELQLEKVKWLSQKEQLQKKYVDALAQRDMLQIGVLNAQLAQAAAQLDLINEQLARVRAVAPFDGVVVAGDLTQRINAPVKRGDPLLQIAPLDHYRVILAVSEADIAQLTLGQKGALNLTSLPDKTFPFTVKQITPVAEEKEGLNTFLVEAQLEQGSANLRPGMQGAGKITVGKRQLLWVWTHSLTDWLKLTVWRWWK